MEFTLLEKSVSFSYSGLQQIGCPSTLGRIICFTQSLLINVNLIYNDVLPNIWVLWPAAVAAKSLQSCPTLRPHRRQPTRLPFPGILQARTLEWVAISFSNACK